MTATRSLDGIPNDETPQQNHAGREGMCFPYNDCYVICSQVLAIMATVVLWMYWFTLLISVFALVLHQIIIWSYHMDKVPIRALPVVSGIAAFLLFSNGMIVLVTAILDSDIVNYNYDDDDDDSFDDDDCPEMDKIIMAFVAFSGSMFWLGSFGLMTNFVERGRQARWRAMLLALSEPEEGKKKREDGENITEDTASGDFLLAEPKERRMLSNFFSNSMKEIMNRTPSTAVEDLFLAESEPTPRRTNEKKEKSTSITSINFAGELVADPEPKKKAKRKKKKKSTTKSKSTIPKVVLLEDDV